MRLNFAQVALLGILPFCLVGTMSGCSLFEQENVRSSYSAKIWSLIGTRDQRIQTKLEALESVGEQSGGLSRSQRQAIEKDIITVQQALDVPQGIFWCFLFAENDSASQRKIGHLNPTALSELNLDTDLYRKGTLRVLKRHLHIDSETPHLEPESNTTSRIFTSAVYLSNRYQQLKTALDHEAISYDPDVLWFFAIAAHQQGMRTVFSLLTHELMSRGARSLSRLLSDLHFAKSFLTHARSLDYPLRQLWPSDTARNQVQELSAFMAAVTSCVLPESPI